jgi:hypothetical protein
MKNTITFSFLVVLFLITNICFSQNTIYIRLKQGDERGQESPVFEYYPNMNFNYHKDFLGIAWTNDGNVSIARGLIQFYLGQIPQNAQIASAKLSLYANPDPTNPNHYGPNSATLRRITTPWHETNVTWVTRPEYTIVNEVHLSTSEYYYQDYVDINVKNLVQDMVSNPTSSYGFMLTLDTEIPYRSLNFASSMCLDSTRRPKLVVTYNTVGITSNNNIVPGEYNLYQCYPNPFNPVTNIKYDIPRSSFVTLKVYDIRGNEVATLVNNNQNAGQYIADFNGKNISSGVYYYKITAGSYSSTQKMILIK